MIIFKIYWFLWTIILFCTNTIKKFVVKTRFILLSFMFLCLLTALTAQETGTLKGIVKDDKEMTIAFANVYIKETNHHTKTNEQGEFEINGIIPGTFTVISQLIGYSVFEKTGIIIKPGKTTLIHIELNKTIMSGFRPFFLVQEGIAEKFNTDKYKANNPNPFYDTIKDPQSTFSLDVNSASYSVVRRILKQNYLPENNYVRIEDMINYFSYHYPEPKGNDPVSISVETGVCPWNKAHDIMKIGLKSKSGNNEDSPETNLVFLIDVSGSMSDPNKLPLVKQSLKMLVNHMKTQDQIAIVTFASQVNVKLDSTPGTKKQIILDTVDELYASGSTIGDDGIKMAYDIAVKYFDKRKMNRIILCTDGEFNIDARPNTEKLINNKRNKEIALSILAFGMDKTKGDKLKILADKGIANYHFVNDLAEAKQTLAKEMNRTYNSIAKDVNVQIEFNPLYISAYRLIGYENHPLNSDDVKSIKTDADEIGADQTVTVLYEIMRNNPKEQEINNSLETFKSKEFATIKFRYKDPDGTESKELNHIVSDSYPESNSKDFNFACAVAGFGLKLQKTKFSENITWEDIINLTKQSIDKDNDAYRKEFIHLVKKAQILDLKNNNSFE